MSVAPATTPRRIQRRRKKGWRMPEGAIYVGRPSRWGNPFPVATYGAERAVEYFQAFATGEFVKDIAAAYRRAERAFYGTGPATLTPGESATIFLRGRDLACWCPLPCGVLVGLEWGEFGGPWELCAKPAGHAGQHAPSPQPAWCHADVLLELANR